jgi:putative SOS response-associated peptidase YedK
MCGRFTLTIHQLGDVVAALNAVIEESLLSEYRPRYNVAPGDRHWLLRSARASGKPSDARRREIIPADWGLINHWSKDPSIAFKQINARAETLTQRPAWRDAFRSRRCILPADGFYEWRGPKGAREPLWFHRPDRGLLLFAGLYDGWVDPDTGEVRKTFTIITTTPNELVEPIHDRMPVIIDPEHIDQWLGGAEPAALLAPPPASLLEFHPASPRVNSARNDDPECLDPDDPNVKKQLSLF